MNTSADPKSVSDDAAWNMWFMCLPVWDRRTVLRHELEWHDGFVNGLLSFTDLRVLIDQGQGVVSKNDSDTCPI